MEKITKYQKAAIENVLGVHELDYWDVVEEVFPRRLVNFELDCLSYEDAIIMIEYLNKNYGPHIATVVCKTIMFVGFIYLLITLFII